MTTREIAFASIIAMAATGTAFAADDMAAPVTDATTTAAPMPPEAPSLDPAAAGAARLPSFEALDIDGSGAISSEEARVVPTLVDSFPTADADRSGDLSKAEYAALSHT
jgi:hypothetical protein